MVKKISDTEISNTPLVKVKENSVEAYYINPKFLNIVEGQDFDQYRRLSGYGSGDNLFDPPGGGDGNKDVPQLADIESVTKSIYYDPATKKARAKLVIKIRNSSTKPIIGIDARIAIAGADGGNA
jgi:hypothetical protein